jgi:hypothetical protein
VLLLGGIKEKRMNTKKSRKNLSLNRETLRSLENEQIANVVGGLQQGAGQDAAAFSWNGTCWSCKSCIACA